MVDMSPAVRWLTAQEEHLWRGWLKLNAKLASTLQRELQQDVGLSMPDFEVLVHLTDNPEGRVRVTELAGLLQWERSRVSHHIKRMEHRGLVGRVECSEDGRGAFVVITPQGRAAIEEAGVRRPQRGGESGPRSSHRQASDPNRPRADAVATRPSIRSLLKASSLLPSVDGIVRLRGFAK
jgi:DNA-binding MarR family transcriptional regulator